jgi:hypothetical protein
VEQAGAVLALCSDKIRKQAGYRRDRVTDALIQQSVLEFRERKQMADSFKACYKTSLFLSLSLFLSQ